MYVDGQADSLKSVVDTPFGKVGGLNCWEHIQPLLRYYEYSQGVEIHVAGWPPFWKQPKDIPVRHLLLLDTAFPFQSHETRCKNKASLENLSRKGDTNSKMC